MRKFIASFEISQQITEDSWKRQKYHLEVDEKTLLGDILKWQQDIVKEKTIYPDLTIYPLHQI